MHSRCFLRYRAFHLRQGLTLIDLLVNFHILKEGRGMRAGEIRLGVNRSCILMYCTNTVCAYVFKLCDFLRQVALSSICWRGLCVSVYPLDIVFYQHIQTSIGGNTDLVAEYLAVVLSLRQKVTPSGQISCSNLIQNKTGITNQTRAKFTKSQYSYKKC